MAHSRPPLVAGLPSYAELRCRSNFSFLTGASHPEELVQRAAALGYAGLALTDECSLAGVVRAHTEAEALGLHLVIGTEMQLVLPTEPQDLQWPADEAWPDDAGGYGRAGDGAGGITGGSADGETAAALRVAGGVPHARLLLLATSRRGYANLSQWVTLARRRAPKGRYRAHPGDLEGRAPQLPALAGLPGCLVLLVVQAVPAPAGLGGQGDGPDPLAPEATPPSFEALLAQARWLQTWVGPDDGGQPRAGLAVALQHQRFDDERVQLAQQLAEATGLPIVATGQVLMHSRARKPLQDVLSATRLRRPVAECGTALQANGEAHMRSRQRLAEVYPATWLQASVAWARRCTFKLSELRYEYPQEIVPAGHTATSWLRELTERGLRMRCPDGETGESAALRQQIESELALIARLKYEPYFLTVADLVHWARQQGILCQGRGSAANSAVCYCLGVTEVDPRRVTLLFERFISVERNEPPDIDIDFEHQRREEVIQYIYRKYGRHRAALTGVVIRYQARSAVRDVGRALGFDLDRIEALSRSQHWFDGKTIAPERLRENGFDPDAPLTRLWAELTGQLYGFPRHLSQHPGGFLIASEHIADLVPVENAAMADRTVVQWDKDDLDALGLLKVDVLALGMLSAIQRALASVVAKEPARWQPQMRALVPGAPLALPMSALPYDDAAVYDMLCSADSVGVFQVESRAQMSMLPRLKPREFYDLVVEVAIVRPGPIQGGMVHPYLKRRSGQEPVVYPKPEAEQALKRTWGVPIFQEQVMQLAILAAGFSGGEADQLRRGMAAWKRKGGLGPFREKLVGRMVARGYELAYAEAIFKQIEGFGEYGFPESHAASFALLVYVSAWLKRHHPDAFLASLLNSQPMGFYMPAQLVRDARAHGVQVLPVCVQASEVDTVLVLPAGGSATEGVASMAASVAAGQGGPHSPSAASLWPVRLGLNRLIGLGDDAAQRIAAARAQGPFSSVEDLTRRAALDAHALQCLADGNALRALAGHRRQAAWAVAGMDTRPTALLHAARTHEAQAPALEAPSEGAELLADYRRTGLSLTTHPLALLRLQLDALKVLPAALLRHCRSGQLARASGIVTHRQRPPTAKGVVFVTLEDDTGPVNVIVWPAVASAQRQPLLGARLLTVFGVWQSENGVSHLIARKLLDHTAWLQALSTRSRDFH